jgi:hypothetical protein
MWKTIKKFNLMDLNQYWFLTKNKKLFIGHYNFTFKTIFDFDNHKNYKLSEIEAFKEIIEPFFDSYKNENMQAIMDNEIKNKCLGICCVK